MARKNLGVGFGLGNLLHLARVEPTKGGEAVDLRRGGDGLGCNGPQVADVDDLLNAETTLAVLLVEGGVAGGNGLPLGGIAVAAVNYQGEGGAGDTPLQTKTQARKGEPAEAQGQQEADGGIAHLQIHLEQVFEQALDVVGAALLHGRFPQVGNGLEFILADFTVGNGVEPHVAVGHDVSHGIELKAPVDVAVGEQQQIKPPGGVGGLFFHQLG